VGSEQGLRQLREFRSLHGGGERVHAGVHDPVPRLGGDRGRARPRHRPDHRVPAALDRARQRGAAGLVRHRDDDLTGSQVAARLFGLLGVGVRPVALLPRNPETMTAVPLPQSRVRSSDWLLLVTPAARRQVFT